MRHLIFARVSKLHPPMTIREKVGYQIRQCRLAKGLAQEELATSLDITPASLSNIERGKVSPSLRTIESIANILEVPIRNLFLDA